MRHSVISIKSWSASTDFRTWVNFGIHVIFYVSKPNIILFSWGILDSFCATDRIRTRGLQNRSQLPWHSLNRFKLVVKHTKSKITNKVRRNQPVHGFIESHNDSFWCTVTSLSPGSFSFMCCLRLPLAQRQRTKIRLEDKRKRRGRIVSDFDTGCVLRTLKPVDKVNTNLNLSFFLLGRLSTLCFSHTASLHFVVFKRQYLVYSSC